MTWLWLSATLALGIVYRWVMVRRNMSIHRPPLRDAAGRPLDLSEFTFSDGTSVSYVDVGSGPALLLIPGADGIKETFTFQVTVLAVSYRVICADLRSDISADHTFDRFAEDALELLDELGIERVTVLGQSLGGAIAMRLAVLFPGRVRGLVLGNTLAHVSYKHVGLNRTGVGAVALFATRFLPTFLAAALGRLWCRLGVWIFDRSPGWRRTIHYALWIGGRTIDPAISSARVARLRATDLRPQLPGLKVPALVIKGPEDHYTPPVWAEEIAALIPGAQYRTIPETGHISHVSRSDRFNRIVLDWLRVQHDRAPFDQTSPQVNGATTVTEGQR